LSRSKATGWPPKSFSARESAGAEQRFTFADHVIAANATAASIAARKHDGSSAAKPIAVTSGVWKADSITAIDNGFTGNEDGLEKEA
jgi:hypothetical protein